MKNTSGMTLKEMTTEAALQEGIEIGIQKGAVLAVPKQLLLHKGMEPT